MYIDKGSRHGWWERTMQLVTYWEANESLVSQHQEKSLEMEMVIALETFVTVALYKSTFTIQYYWQRPTQTATGVWSHLSRNRNQTVGMCCYDGCKAYMYTVAGGVNMTAWLWMLADDCKSSVMGHQSLRHTIFSCNYSWKLSDPVTHLYISVLRRHVHV